MKYFLAKSEPDTYSIDDLERDRKTTWDGVKNPQAVRAIREMQPGDRVFIYHSGGASAIVGWATVRSEPRDDPKNPKSAVVDLEFGGRLDPPATESRGGLRSQVRHRHRRGAGSARERPGYAAGPPRGVRVSS